MGATIPVAATVEAGQPVVNDEALGTARRRETTMQWTDLTSLQRCVLLEAVEVSSLDTVLLACVQGREWAEKLPEVPRLAAAVEWLVDHGLIEVTKDEEEDQHPAAVPRGQVHEVVSDPANWWSPEGVGPFGLVSTEAGDAVFNTSTRENLYDFH